MLDIRTEYTIHAVKAIAILIGLGTGMVFGGKNYSAEQPRVTKKEFATTLLVCGPNMPLVGFDNAGTLNGSRIAVTSRLSHNSVTVSRPVDLAVDRRGSLYIISGANGGAIAVYDSPLTANGNRRPDRLVFGAKTGLSKSPAGIAVDRDNGLLYAANVLTGIVVFDIRSPESFHDDIPPVRAFTVDMTRFRPQQIRFARGSLFLIAARGATSDIVVFDSPGDLRGNVTPSRVISYSGFDNRIGIDVDEAGRLLVATRTKGQVMVYNDAFNIDGATRPDVELSMVSDTTKATPSFATIDSSDRLYVADANANEIGVVENFSKRGSGQCSPDRIIKSPELIVPNRLLLVER